MRAFVHVAFVLSLFALTACSTSSDGTPPDLRGQIETLERTQQQMRKQYDNLGVTLIRLESRIARLKARANNNPLPSNDSPEPAPVAAPEREPVVSNGPVTLAPAIGGLTEQDMQVQATPQSPVSAAPTNIAPAAGGQTYIVHLASYLESAPVRAGWQQLSQQQRAQIGDLKPYVTSFEDTQNRKWLRLSAGPLSSSGAAHQRCDAIKANSGWCDVLRVNASALRELHVNAQQN